ncbi:hypothetical protein ACHAP5_011873 [Fusarium lateritium]
MLVTMPAERNTVRVAAVQAEGCYFDLEAAIEKTCKLIEEAAGQGCDLIAFPEVWIPNYLGWFVDYKKPSRKCDGPEMQKICATAGKHGIAVSLGYSENDDDSLYLAQSHIGKDGAIKMNRRKIKLTYVECILYGDGSGASLINVVEEPGVGKVGALSCWEHSQPLLRYHTYSQDEEIHVAAWPPMNYLSSFPEGSALWSQCREGVRNLPATHVIEGNCFVIVSSSFYTQNGVDRQRLGDEKLYHIGGGGCACIIAPDDRIITTDLGEEEEGLLIADLDMDEILKVKTMLDVHGHYSRSGLLWLVVDNREKQKLQPGGDSLRQV